MRMSENHESIRKMCVCVCVGMSMYVYALHLSGKKFVTLKFSKLFMTAKKLHRGRSFGTIA